MKGKTGTPLQGSYKALPLGSVLARMARNLPVEKVEKKKIRVGRRIDPKDFTEDSNCQERKRGFRIKLSDNDLRKAVDIYRDGLERRTALRDLSMYGRNFGIGGQQLLIRLIEFAGKNKIPVPVMKALANVPKRFEYDCEVKNGVWIWA